MTQIANKDMFTERCNVASLLWSGGAKTEHKNQWRYGSGHLFLSSLQTDRGSFYTERTGHSICESYKIPR